MIQPTPSGEFRQRVTLMQRVTGNTNELGETVTTDPVAIGDRWAKVSPLNAQERLNAAQNYQDVTHEVRLRFDPDLTHADTLLFRGRTLNIASVIDVEEQHVELLILCREQQ